jgi:hypothetical protein
MFNITGYTNDVELEYIISFIGIVLFAISSSYLCCKFINNNNEINNENQNVNNNNENQNVNNNNVNNNNVNNNNNNNEINENNSLLPKYKLRDDPPEYV